MLIKLDLIPAEPSLLFSYLFKRFARSYARFCSLLEELTKITETKFIIVTHHALTMSKMDRLYGVTMPEKGISQLVSVDLQKAEELVA